MDQQLIIFIKRGQLIVAILAGALVVFLLGQLFLQDKSLNQQNANQITVLGDGKVYVKPDVALISSGVTTQDTTVAGVTKSNTDKMNAVIAVLKSLKIDDKDIQSTNYSLTPVYENYSTPIVVPMMYPATGGVSGGAVSAPAMMKTGTTLKGYKLEQDIQVKIRDFTKIGDVLAQSTTAGANTIGDLQFTIDNPEQFREQARADAIKKAQANAQNLAKESGIGLGKLINVFEGYSPSPVMYSSAAKGLGAAAPDATSIPTIQPGQQEIDVTINLTYQVK